MNYPTVNRQGVRKLRCGKFTRGAVVRENSTASAETFTICCYCGTWNYRRAAVIMNFRVTRTFSRNANKEAGKVCPSTEVRCMCTCRIATHRPRNVIIWPQCTIDNEVPRAFVTVRLCASVLCPLPTILSFDLQIDCTTRNFSCTRGGGNFSYTRIFFSFSFYSSYSLYFTLSCSYLFSIDLNRERYRESTYLYKLRIKKGSDNVSSMAMYLQCNVSVSRFRRNILSLIICLRRHIPEFILFIKSHLHSFFLFYILFITVSLTCRS